MGDREYLDVLLSTDGHKPRPGRRQLPGDSPMQFDRRSSWKNLASSIAVAWALTLVMLAIVGCLREARAAEPPAPVDISDRISAGSLIELPEGTFTISKPCLPPRNKPLCLTGKGPTRTVIKLTADMPAAITLAGDATRNVSYWEISNLTLDGDSHAANGIALSYATQGRFDRLLLINFRGTAIDGHTWWDSLITQVDVVKCGDAEKQLAAVRLWNDPAINENCNNLTWIAGRFESNPWVSLWIGGAGVDEAGKPIPQHARCRINRFLSVKFHSTLPGPTAFDHVWLQAADDHAFVACNLTNCGGTAVVQTACNDNSFEGSHIGNSRVAGMRVEKSRFDASGITWSKQGGRNKANLVVDGAEVKVTK